MDFPRSSEVMTKCLSCVDKVKIYDTWFLPLTYYTFGSNSLVLAFDNHVSVLIAEPF